MTCHVTSSPYLMKWLFTKEDTVKSYLTPKHGRLVIHSSGSWFVPLKGSTSTMQNSFVDLDSPAVLTGSKARQQHLLILREIKRKELLRAEAAVGYLLSYMLMHKDGGDYVMLLRGSLSKEVVEFADASFVMDDPPLARQTNLQALLLRSDSVPIESWRVRIAISAEEEDSNKTKKPQGILAQRKLDGDRMQAHIMIGPQGKPSVKLFTKKGRPVHMLYSDVAQELENQAMMMMAAQDQPCILDGELIAVDKDGEPLPWCSTKWRYDSAKHAQSLRTLTSGSTSLLLLMPGDAPPYGYNPGDGEESDAPTFAPRPSAISSWDCLGTSEKERLKVREAEGTLLFVVFDLLMYKGRPIVHLPDRKSVV